MSSTVTTRRGGPAAALPPWTSVLVVVAHPDDESFGLGAVLDSFTGAGAAVEVLCLTQGEASTLHEVSSDLATVREAELSVAATALGVTHTTLHHHPDGALSEVCPSELALEVVAAAVSCHADGLLVFDTSGVTGHPDHAGATAAGLLAARTLGLPVLGWTLPETVSAQLNRQFGASFTGHSDQDIDLQVPVERVRQRLACHAHASQSPPGSILWHRLELLGDTESLRWLRPPDDAAEHPTAREHSAARGNGAETRPVRVQHRGENRLGPRHATVVPDSTVLELAARNSEILADRAAHAAPAGAGPRT